MAFIGMVFAGMAVVIFGVVLFFMLAFLIAAAILKIIGKKKDSKGMRIGGNVCLVLGIICAVPLALVVGGIAFGAMNEQVTLPDGSTVYVPVSDVKEMTELAKVGGSEASGGLEKLLTRTPNLIYYRDINREGLLEYGLELGNAAVVKTAVKYGAEFDDPRRYEHMAYENNSMDYYLSGCSVRAITTDDVEIIKLMFEKGVSTEYENRYDGTYSNYFGEAVWAVLYNDETVTDTELEFIRVFIENGLGSDSGLLLYEEKPSNISFSPDLRTDVARDEKYNKLMKIIRTSRR